MLVTPELLKTFSLFEALGAEDLNNLSQRSQTERFARRAVILNAGSQEDRVCFLFEGRLQGVDFTIDGREVGLYFVDPGDYCGELSVFDFGAQPEYVIALNPAVVVFVPVEALREIATRHPAIMTSLGYKLAARVRQMTLQRSLLGLPNITQRVCCQLWLLLSDDQKKLPEKSSEIKNPPTHMEIAIMVNVSRETVTRVFQHLQKLQIVSRDGPTKLIINDLQTLKGVAEGNQQL